MRFYLICSEKRGPLEGSWISWIQPEIKGTGCFCYVLRPQFLSGFLVFPQGSKGICIWSLSTYKRDLSENHTLSPPAYCYPVLIGVWNSPPSLCTAVYGRNSILHVYQIWSHLDSRSTLFKSPALGTESSSFQDHVSITNCYKHSQTELTSVFWDVSVFILKKCSF